jgi:uroporphyrinogen decarboxylase
MKIINDRLLQVLAGQKADRAPVWLMRQAGRVLPQYRALRSQFDGFKSFIKTPEAAAEATIQPIDYFGVDAAIIFSDILTVPEAMGCNYEMVESQGPLFPYTIKTRADIDRLVVPDVQEKLGYVFDAISLAVKSLEGLVPLIGFAGAPFTILAYLVEGKGSKTFSKPKALLYQDPEAAHKLLQKITDTTILYLKAQVEAGASALQLFDSWGGVLTPYQYAEFSYPYLAQIAEALAPTPVIAFPKGANGALAQFKGSPFAAVGIDWCISPNNAISILGDKAIQGNTDPCALYADDFKIVETAKNLTADFAGHLHIANLGHGLYPDLHPEKVRLFVQTLTADPYEVH